MPAIVSRQGNAGSTMESLRQPTEASERFAVPAARFDERALQAGQERAELERMRAALEAKRRQLELSARRQAEFLASMSDDLRTPLNSLLILAKLLADNDGNNLTAQQVDFAQTIYAAATDLLSLVDDVLDLARIEAERLAPDVAEVTFRDLRIYLLRAFRQTARDRHTVFDVVLAPDLPAGIRTDGRRLRHILKNMLSQAFKCAHGGRVALSIAAAGSLAIFEALRRPEGSIGCEHAGGLGLSICRELAQSLGGNIRVASLHGDNVRLALDLPFDLVAEPAAAPAAPEDDAAEAIPIELAGLPPALQAIHPERRSRCVDDAVMLIVEGNAQVASVMLDLVRANGFQGVVATDLGTMRVLLREVAPEAVLIGGSLMDIDGWTTLELLKRDPQTRRVPISMSYFDARRYLCLQLGAGTDWAAGAAERMLAGLDAAAGRRAERLLLAGVPDASYGRELARSDDGRRAVRVASGADALGALHAEGCDALVVGPALGDMSAVELIRAISAAELCQEDLPLALIGGAAARPPAGTLELGMLRHRARLEEVLGETALYLGQTVAHVPSPRRDALSRRREVSPELAGRKALIVDDDIYNVYAMTGALEQQGMRVVLAENAKEGIEALRAHPDAEVVLIDITMPEIDGDGVIGALRSAHPRELPIIAVTPRATPGDREKCIGAGASDYISKPVNVEQMLALLRTWLARAR